MKVLLLYYTGTYNTRFLTGKISERFVDLGYEVDQVEIDCDTPVIPTGNYEYVGFGYPIYGFNAPHPFLKYLRKLKFIVGQKYFIYKNSGETMAMNNASSQRIMRFMGRQKAVFCGEYHFVMPYNIHFPFDPAFIEEIIYEDKKLLEIMFHHLEHGIAPRLKSNPLYNIGAFFVGIQAIGGNVNSFFYRVNEKECIKCGLCVSACPEKNIRLEKGKVTFRHRCDMCMRCSFYCPKKAISIGLLNGWLVHKYYDLERIWQQDQTPPNYITKESRGFYKCFITTFHNIDDEYDTLFSGQ